MTRPTANTTAYFTHPDCGRHEMGGGHPESPQRLEAIEAMMHATGLMRLVSSKRAPLATPAQLALAHTPDHIGSIDKAVQMLHQEHEAVGMRYLALDPDTQLNAHTYPAAMRAVGAVIAAIDAVLAGECTNAFCAVRPPGHHATRSRSMGFCVFNQIAVGAKYAVQERGLKRVAIVDFDVHHGNGTEDIVSYDSRILMVGLFQHPFYPYGGTGDVAPNMVNLPFAAHTTGEVIRREIARHWLPALEAFGPELILISAGFDAHRNDDLGGLALVEEDYVWITREVMRVANRYAHGRIVSSLEGGYNLRALASSVGAHVKTLVQG